MCFQALHHAPLDDQSIAWLLTYLAIIACVRAHIAQSIFHDVLCPNRIKQCNDVLSLPNLAQFANGFLLTKAIRLRFFSLIV
jgi:hypothetical protein